MNAMRRTATIDYRISRVPVLCKDCRFYSQDVGIYPARHVCDGGTADMPFPLPIDGSSSSQPLPRNNYDINVTQSTTEAVERAKVAVGRGWEIVRNMNWRDMTRKEAESNGSRMWGKLLEATSSARQKVADKYYEVREGGNESDDDSPDNTHTQRVLAQYYLSTEGVLPSWLTPPSSLSTSRNTAGIHRGSQSNVSGGSGTSTYRSGNKPVSLQDIYDSAVPNQPPSSQSRIGRNQDLYTSDQTTTGRQVMAGDRLRNKLRPQNSRPSGRPGSNGDQDAETSAPNLGGSDYSGRSRFGGGDDYDPYNYQQQGGYDANRSRDPRQGQYSRGLPNRPGGRR